MPIICNSDARNLLLAACAVVAIGFGTATAAISINPGDQPNPAMRPLTIGRSLHVQPAFGPDDEDCVWATRKSIDAAGRPKVERQLECAE